MEYVLLYHEKNCNLIYDTCNSIMSNKTENRFNETFQISKTVVLFINNIISMLLRKTDITFNVISLLPDDWHLGSNESVLHALKVNDTI